MPVGGVSARALVRVLSEHHGGNHLPRLGHFLASITALLDIAGGRIRGPVPPAAKAVEEPKAGRLLGNGDFDSQLFFFFFFSFPKVCLLFTDRSQKNAHQHRNRKKKKSTPQHLQEQKEERRRNNKATITTPASPPAHKEATVLSYTFTHPSNEKKGERKDEKKVRR